MKGTPEMAELGRALKRAVTIQLGALVSITVDVRSAIEAETSLSNVCLGTEDAPHAASGVGRKYECKTCAAETGFKKGRKVGSGYQVVEDEELAALEVEAPTSMTITVHDREEVEAQCLPGETTYFLSVPQGASPDGYVLLRELIKGAPDKVAVCIWGVRAKPHMWRFGVFGDAITLHQLVWPEAVKQSPEVPSVTLPARALGLGAEILALSEQTFTVEAYRDTAAQARDALFARQDVIAAADGSSLSAPAAMSLLDMLEAEAKSITPAVAAKAPARRRKSAAA